jgi:hypothetical protein
MRVGGILWGGGRPPPGGAPRRPKPLSSFRRFLIADGSGLQAPLVSGKRKAGFPLGLGHSEKYFARSGRSPELREIFSLEKVGLYPALRNEMAQKLCSLPCGVMPYKV